MRIVVIGAGEVGSSIAASLDDEHEIVVVDIDGAKVEALTYSYDVLAIEGDGTSMPVLEDADVGGADLVIACTDETRPTSSPARRLASSETPSRSLGFGTRTT
jgi:trk system potassium uptake protein TrkA